ncbi:biliverdin-producing heme oxygenase [Mucilaginibacter sp. UR6-1]|uniref:biliverdin-producing heme oxygenase n=1 Tax=Mucilaginibacter sp. UR6-1 TaxID=1435643 RepID=UPI001E33DA72|nr:biliverdin-producing heme oxygenase [Mucilaginibacter sp. UR6-1]MCC8411107.1 biliverdin-producing heme oxygenase [Mucilaginibacter sp. UR6-1]
MLSEKLKEETKTYHHETEVALIGRIKAIKDEQDYASLLKMFYSYFGGLEKNIDAAIDTGLMDDYHERRKTSAIADDLQALDADVPPVAGADSLPAIQNHLQALGALYVIEGSTLGGKIISKMIGQKLDAANGEALTFFNSYGEDTVNMWNSFKEKMNAQAQTDEEQAAVIETANSTFKHFAGWIARYN